MVGQAAWLGAALGATGAILLGFGVSNPVPFWIGVGLSATAVIAQLFIGPRYAKLIAAEGLSRVRASERAAGIQKILDAGLRAMMDELNVDFAQARISIYRHKRDYFIMLARVSENLSLQKPGRGRYPDGEGIIRVAWDNQDAVAVDLPEDRADWEKKCAGEYNMEPTSLSRLSMQSLSMVGKRIDMRKGSQVVPVGLIVIESLAKRGVNGKTMDAVNTSTTYPLLEQILLEAIDCLDEQDVEAFRSLG